MGFGGIFLVVESIAVNDWMNGIISFLPTLRNCLVMFIHVKALPVVQIKVCLCCFVEVTEAKTCVTA